MAESERWRAVVVVDDESTRRRIRRRLAARPTFELAAECASAVDGIRALRQQRVDLLIAGTRLADLDGFELLEIAGEKARPAAVVFLSPSEEGAFRAFELGAADFLPLPLDEQRFVSCLERVAERLATQRRLRAAAASPDAVTDGAAAPERDGSVRRLVARSGDRWVVVPVETIVWIESDGNYVQLHCGGERHRLRSSIGELERQLDPARFFRVHRSTIVRLEQVLELELTEHGDYRVRLRDGSQVELTRARREAFVAALERGPAPPAFG